MKDKIKYKKLVRKYHKQLIKAAKNFVPWEYGYIYELLDVALHYMKDYFELGYNVGQIDESRLEIVKSLTDTINLFEKGTTIEESQEFKDLSQELFLARCKNLPILESSQERFLELYQEQENTRRDYLKKFFNKIAEDIEMWWD